MIRPLHTQAKFISENSEQLESLGLITDEFEWGNMVIDLNEVALYNESTEGLTTVWLKGRDTSHTINVLYSDFHDLINDHHE